MPMQLTQADYEALARFRFSIRQYLVFAEQGARAVGLTSQQHQALLAIKAQTYSGVMTVGELAKRLLLRPNSAAELVDRLAAIGVIVREPALHDRRVVSLQLTPRGEDLLAQLSERNLRELRAVSPAFERLLGQFAGLDGS